MILSNRIHNNDEIQEDDEAAVFIQPNPEHELSIEKRQECRNILREIKDFGVNQRQILFLIQLLTLELENGEAMRSIIKVVTSVRSTIPVESKSLILPEDASSSNRNRLIVPENS